MIGFVAPDPGLPSRLVESADARAEAFSTSLGDDMMATMQRRVLAAGAELAGLPEDVVMLAIFNATLIPVATFFELWGGIAGNDKKNAKLVARQFERMAKMMKGKLKPVAATKAPPA